MKLKIGIVGCGAIGSSLAKEIKLKFRKEADLVALFDIQPQKSALLAKKISRGQELCVKSLDDLIKRSDLVIEASSAKVSGNIAYKSLLKGRKVMLMSIGGVVGCTKQLLALASRFGGQVYLPSGAVSGLDGLKAANIAGVSKVLLVTRKNPAAFAGVKYVTNHFKLAGLKQDKVLFDGPAARAVKYFPQNINVAAVLGLAGIGAAKTRVKIIASPKVKKNIHEVLIESAAANIFTRTENILHPDNPKTSYLAVLSAVATLRQILQPIKVGT